MARKLDKSSASAPSDGLSSVDRAKGNPMDEEHFSEIDVAMLYIEEARARAERAAANLRDADAEQHLIEAVERAQAELSDVARRLRQGTFFAVPASQTSL